MPTLCPLAQDPHFGCISASSLTSQGEVPTHNTKLQSTQSPSQWFRSLGDQPWLAWPLRLRRGDARRACRLMIFSPSDQTGFHFVYSTFTWSSKVDIWEGHFVDFHRRCLFAIRSSIYSFLQVNGNLSHLAPDFWFITVTLYCPYGWCPGGTIWCSVPLGAGSQLERVG